jgi:hypothetical protein
MGITQGGAKQESAPVVNREHLAEILSPDLQGTIPRICDLMNRACLSRRHNPRRSQLLPLAEAVSVATAPIVNQRGPFLEQIENKAARLSDGRIKPPCYRDRVLLGRSSLITIKPTDAQGTGMAGTNRTAPVP